MQDPARKHDRSYRDISRYTEVVSAKPPAPEEKQMSLACALTSGLVSVCLQTSAFNTPDQHRTSLRDIVHSRIISGAITGVFRLKSPDIT